MKKFKKYLSVVLACTIAVSAAVVSSSAVDNDDIDTYGSGLEKTSDATNNLQNGSFEEPLIGEKIMLKWIMTMFQTGVHLQLMKG